MSDPSQPPLPIDEIVFWAARVRFRSRRKCWQNRPGPALGHAAAVDRTAALSSPAAGSPAAGDRTRARRRQSLLRVGGREQGRRRSSRPGHVAGPLLRGSARAAGLETPIAGALDPVETLLLGPKPDGPTVSNLALSCRA
jgi:hypothetical protein